MTAHVIDRARIFATLAHGPQMRKYTGHAYIEHPRAVAERVALVPGATDAMVAAAWLHDVLEDTPVTFMDLLRQFGAEIACMVRDVTDVSTPQDGNRAVRKRIDREHLAHATPEAMTIKLADILDNAADIAKNDPKFARVYLPEMRAVLAVLTEGDPGLLMDALRTLDEMEARLDSGPSQTFGERYGRFLIDYMAEKG